MTGDLDAAACEVMCAPGEMCGLAALDEFLSVTFNGKVTILSSWWRSVM